jgi:rod shape-determining protein MreC
MIDKGSAAGIAVGMPVIVSEGILVGKVEEVSDYSAKISLLTNSSSIVNAVDLNTEAKGVVRGEYGLGIILDLVSQADVLNEGDDVITSGLGGNYPRGLLIGRIQEFGFTADKLFQQAVIMPKVKYSELQMVAVIKN